MTDNNRFSKAEINRLRLEKKKFKLFPRVIIRSNDKDQQSTMERVLGGPSKKALLWSTRIAFSR